MSIFEYDEEATRKAISRDAYERGVKDSILQLLEETAPNTFRIKRKIMSETNGEVLKKWLKAAARAESIDEFIKKTGEK